jgi:outer membrane protein assembly factor BamA
VQRYRCECRLDIPRYEETSEAVFIRKVDPNALRPRRAIGFGPVNRVDYSSVLLGVARGDADFLRPHWRGRAQLIVPFRENTRGYLGFDLDLAIPVSGRKAELRVKGFKKTATNDDWQFSVAENGAALELTHNDVFDYYERAGGRVALWLHPAWEWEIEGGVYLDQSRSLVTKTVPSLANNSRPLRDNPAIDEGEILGATIAATFDTRVSPARPASAWFGSVQVERGFATGPGDFPFTSLTLDVRRYNRLWRKINVDLRGRIFTAFDDLPRQRLQSLNGYSGVRGLHDIPFDVRRGDRLAVFSSELRIPMPELPLLKFLYTSWDLTAFGDLGLLDLDGGSEGAFSFLDTKLDRWGKSVGIGISGESFLPFLAFYVAQDLDRHNKRPRFIMRANRSL